MPSGFYLRLIQATLLVNILLTGGCSDSDPVAPALPIAVDAVRIVPEGPTLFLNEGQQLQAVALDATGASIAGRSVAWTSLGPDVVAITAQGFATGVALGNATVRAVIDGVLAEATVEVRRRPSEQIVVEGFDPDLLEGTAFTLAAAVRDQDGEVVPDRPITWESTNPTVAAVRAGRVQALGEGSTTLRAIAGDLSREFVVRVRPDFGGELLVQSQDVAAGLPRIYRTDLRDTPTSLMPVFPEAGQMHARVSPDGQRIAYTCRESGSAICVANLDGSDIQVLSAGADYYEDQPSWSPDGQWLAFRRWAAGPGVPGFGVTSDIWVMDANGANQQNVTQDAVHSQHEPVWSPLPVNGALRIAFVEDEVIHNVRRSRIATIHIDGTGLRYETMGATKVESTPSWSPDGREILFARQPFAAVPELYAVDVTSGAERRLLPYLLPGGQLTPVWSPNGKYLAFASAHELDASQHWQVYTVRADGTGLTRRTTGGAGRSQLSWIPLY